MRIICYNVVKHKLLKYTDQLFNVNNVIIIAIYYCDTIEFT